MGTKVHCKNYSPGYYSMRDLNEDCNSSSWPMFYGDKTLSNARYCNGYLPNISPELYLGFDKDVLKQKMLEHEEIFKNQVYELHRLYRIQRDMMDEVKRNELHKHQITIDRSSSSTPLASQLPFEDARRWHFSNSPFANSFSVRSQPALGADIFNTSPSTKASPVPPENGCSSNNNEIQASTPSKVRKKLFDLQLPAEEYIDSDDEEQSRDHLIRKHKIPPENSVNLFPGGVKNDRLNDASKSGSSLKSVVCLADLNEPIQVEETIVPVSDFLGQASCHGEINLKSQFASQSKENLLISRYGSSNGALYDAHLGNKGSGRDWLQFSYDAGHSKCNLTAFSQGHEQDKLPLPSQPTHITPNKVHRILPIDHNKRDQWREGMCNGTDLNKRNQDIFKLNHREPTAATDIHSPYSLVNSSRFPNACSHSESQFFNSYAQNHEIFGKKWDFQSTGRPSLGFGSDNCNGFYRGSSSSLSKDIPANFPSLGIDHSFKKVSGLASERSIKYDSDVADLKSRKDLNLNEAVPQRELEIIDLERKPEDHLVVLPWLRAKNACSNEAVKRTRDSNLEEMSFFRVSSNQNSNKSEIAKNSNKIGNIRNIESCNYSIGTERKETCDGIGNRTIPGFPIFGNPGLSKKEISSPVSTSASQCCPPQDSQGIIKYEGRNGEIDINVSCDSVVPDPGEQIAVDVLVVEKKIDTKVSRNFIDLNLGTSDNDEDRESPLYVANISSTAKIVLDIDLEAPPIPENDEDFLCGVEERKLHEPPSQSQDEGDKKAAEAILAISSYSNPNRDILLTENLQWFADAISNCTEDLENDEFVTMTLNLPDVKEDEYMPKPLIPEGINVEETEATTVSSRARRGPARRGRRQRDFQRDILPGLTSLSRHEVTEDLQTFGGLMRATGHTWLCGLSRRNGGGRGRRKVVDPTTAAVLTQQANNSEVVAGLEDRSLKGWGKTTRRPRRQRCPPGNPPPSATVLLT